MTNDPNVNVDNIAETENYATWISVENDGEDTLHLELGPVTIHFYKEEWEELIALVDASRQAFNKKK